MDCIGNARQHAKYLSSLFSIENIKIATLVDLGFGYGHLFLEMVRAFKPKVAVGIEPSEHAFNRLKPARLKSQCSQFAVYQENLLSWSESRRALSRFDLGVCTSVFQYIQDRDLAQILPVLSKRLKYVYFTVPTDIELKRQIKEFKFTDEYAIHRSRQEYQKLISPYFTFIGSRLLESKSHFNEKNTKFSDLLYRF